MRHRSRPTSPETTPRKSTSCSQMQLPTPPNSQTSTSPRATLTRSVPSRSQLLDRSCSSLVMPSPNGLGSPVSASRRSLSPQLERFRSSRSSTREMTPEPESLPACSHYFDHASPAPSNSSGRPSSPYASSREASPELPRCSPGPGEPALRPSSATGLNSKSPQAQYKPVPRSLEASTISGLGYSMLSEYSEVAPAERHGWARQTTLTASERESARHFHPHSDLRSPERLNPQFFKYYSGRSPPPDGAARGVRAGRNGYFEPLREGRSSRISEADDEDDDVPRRSRSEVSGIPDYGMTARHDDWAQRNGFEYSANGSVRPLLTTAQDSAGSDAGASATSATKPKLSALLVEEFDSCVRAHRSMIVQVGVLLIAYLVVRFVFFGTPLPVPPGGTSSYYSNVTYAGTPDFPVLMNIESTFEKVVDSAVGGSELARSIKKSEMAIADLSITVKHSDLKCAATLGNQLARFATDCRDNIRGLSGFSSKVGGAMGSLLGINQWALRELRAIDAASHASPSSFFSYLPSIRPDRTDQAIASIFYNAVEVLESNLKTLVDQGEILLAAMNNLAVQHHAIYEEIIRESNGISHERAEVMASLWSKLGGNAAQLKGFKANAQLLRKIGTYEARARGYVEDTLIQLQQMTAELEELRQRVATPLIGKSSPIPLKVHMRALAKTVERLQRKQEERDRREGVWLRMMNENNEKLGEGRFEDEIIFERDSPQRVEGGGAR